MDGEPRIEGRRLTVLRIRELVEEGGLSAADAADVHDLDVADVYATLTYYYDHPGVMASVEERREEMERRATDRGAETIGELRSASGDDEEPA